MIYLLKETRTGPELDFWRREWGCRGMGGCFVLWCFGLKWFVLVLGPLVGVAVLGFWISKLFMGGLITSRGFRNRIIHIILAVRQKRKHILILSPISTHRQKGKTKSDFDGQT